MSGDELRFFESLDGVLMDAHRDVAHEVGRLAGVSIRDVERFCFGAASVFYAGAGLCSGTAGDVLLSGWSGVCAVVDVNYSTAQEDDVLRRAGLPVDVARACRVVGYAYAVAHLSALCAAWCFSDPVDVGELSRGISLLSVISGTYLLLGRNDPGQKRDAEIAPARKKRTLIDVLRAEGKLFPDPA